MFNITPNLSLGESITILISILSLWILIYTWIKDKPALDVEKHSSKINNDKKSATFTFYLSNIGNQQTTIKEMDICTKKGYIPRCSFLEVSKESLPNLAGHSHSILKSDVASLRFPFPLLPHSSKVIRATLNFDSEDTLKREHNEEQLHYFVRIKPTHKKIFKKFI